MSDLEQGVLSLAEAVCQEDRADRSRQLKQLRFYELFFNGYQALYYDYGASDFLALSDVTEDESVRTVGSFAEGTEPDRYSKVTNIVKAHTESVIAAVTAQTPKTQFVPDNAESPEDVNTAKAYGNIARLIEIKNSAPLLFMRMMYILATQGPVFIYNYYREDKRLGVVSVEDGYEEVPEKRTETYCPQCGSALSVESPEAQPQQAFCEECNMAVTPEVEEVEETSFVQKYTELPKGQEVLEVYGLHNVKIPAGAVKFSDIGYLILEGEYPLSLVKSLYPDKADQLGEAMGGDQEGRDARAPFQDSLVYDRSVSLERIWLQPWEYWRLPEERQKGLESKYPDGLYVVKCDNVILEMHNEALQDHWTVTENPLSNRIIFEPMIKGLIPIQQMLNECVNIILETLEQGIPMTFIDTNVVDVQKIRDTENAVGVTYPAQRPQGMNMDAGFFQTRGTSLPAELPNFIELLKQFAEFVFGSFPSIYGGPSSQGSSKTLGEYERSRVSALQRLSMPWKVLKWAYAKAIYKACEEYRQHLRWDQGITQKMGDSYTTVWIKQSDLSGQVAQMEPEVDESFPLTWPELSARMMEVIGGGNEAILNTLFDMENVNLVKRVLGFPTLYIPGEDIRDAQLQDIKTLLQSASIEGQPTIPPDPRMGGADIRIRTIQAWANSAIGRLHKEENPEGYENVMAQLAAWQMLQAPPPQPGAPTPEGAPPAEAPPQPGPVEPIQE